MRDRRLTLVAQTAARSFSIQFGVSASVERGQNTERDEIAAPDCRIGER